MNKYCFYTQKKKKLQKNLYNYVGLLNFFQFGEFYLWYCCFCRMNECALSEPIIALLIGVTLVFIF